MHTILIYIYIYIYIYNIQLEKLLFTVNTRLKQYLYLLKLYNVFKFKAVQKSC